MVTHILLKQQVFVHSNLVELAQMKIPALKERSRENNLSILKTIALEGPMLKYDMYKRLEKRGIREYSTITRRVDSLKEKGYLDEAGKRNTERGKQKEESMYGLTWRGFIASITIEEVGEKILDVLKINPLLVFPEKEHILTLIKEILTEQEIETIVRSILKAFLGIIPNLELIEDQQLFLMLMSTLGELSLPENFKLSRIPKNAWELLDRPSILKVVKEMIVPFIKQYVDGIKMMYQLVSAFEEFDKFFYSLEIKNQPSQKIKEYVEERLSSLSETNTKIQKIMTEE